MANLSQLKREKMLAFLEKLKEQHTDDDSLIALGEIEKELKSKKYGLVWEEHEEAVDVQMKTQIPVFTEVKEKEICADENGAYNFLLEGFTAFTCSKRHIRERLMWRILTHHIIPKTRNLCMMIARLVRMTDLDIANGYLLCKNAYPLLKTFYQAQAVYLFQLMIMNCTT